MVRLTSFSHGAGCACKLGPDELREVLRNLPPVTDARVLVDAAGVAANFQRMVRIADATGIPVDQMDTELSREIRSTLGLERFASARNTPGAVG